MLTLIEGAQQGKRGERGPRMVKLTPDLIAACAYE